MRTTRILLFTCILGVLLFAASAAEGASLAATATPDKAGGSDFWAVTGTLVALAVFIGAFRWAASES